MSSSTSSSEAGTEAPRWRRFSATLVATALAAAGLVTTVLLVLDPYDTGRFTPFDRPGIAVQGPRTGAASRGRDPQFNAVILGNSQLQMVQPARLLEQTGLRFTSLVIQASRVRENMVLMRYFLRHHPRAKAIVLGLGEHWCTANLRETEFAFPEWLYDPSPWVYLNGMFSDTTLERVAGRIGVLVDPAKRARPDGYWDYTDIYLRQGYGEGRRAAEVLRQPRPTKAIDAALPPPAIADIEAALAPHPETALVLVFPPRHVSAIPQPGTPAAAVEQACFDAYRAFADRHERVVVVDWSGERPESLIEDNFFDPLHYKDHVAVSLERDISAALRTTVAPGAN